MRGFKISDDLIKGSGGLNARVYVQRGFKVKPFVKGCEGLRAAKV